MPCGNCDRSIVVKSYCFYKSRPDYFFYVTDTQFNMETFAWFAVEYQLRWKIDVSCAQMDRSKSLVLWKEVKPYLIKALQTYNNLERLRSGKI
jgi:hypothetical protein